MPPWRTPRAAEPQPAPVAAQQPAAAPQPVAEQQPAPEEAAPLESAPEPAEEFFASRNQPPIQTSSYGASAPAPQGDVPPPAYRPRPAEQYAEPVHQEPAPQPRRAGQPSAETMARFEHLESRIDRMEAEAELVNYGKKSGVDDQFAGLAADEEIEKELAKMKAAAYHDQADSDDQSQP